MNSEYHIQMVTQVMQGQFSARAVVAMVAANLDQDSLANLLKIERHVDNSEFARTAAYVAECRATAAQAATPALAWEMFGRLLHTVQDFYAHSNYVTLWLARALGQRISHPMQAHIETDPKTWPPVSAMQGCDPTLLEHPELMSGRVYWVREAFYMVHALRDVVRMVVPKDAHAWVNLDGPERGPLFPYAIEAATQRTAAELEMMVTAIRATQGEAGVKRFYDV